MRILIVDDEVGARNKVKRFLQAHHDCTIIGECSNGAQALQQIVAVKPDLVFLDIQMPILDGFEVLRELDPDARPLIIFATAYSDKAVKAFEVHAVDYLLKPFDRTRFDGALKRAKELASDGRGEGQFDQVLAALTEMSARPKFPGQILVQGAGGAKVIACESIDYIEAAGNYVVLHVGADQHVMRKSLSALGEMLNPEHFCRVHRQYLVRLGSIVELLPYHKGDMLLVLQTGETLKLSRRYKEELFKHMAL